MSCEAQLKLQDCYCFYALDNLIIKNICAFCNCCFIADFLYIAVDSYHYAFYIIFNVYGSFHFD